MAADELARIRAYLTRRSSAEVAAAHRIDVLRARLLPAGAAILAALRAAAGADDLVLTAAGLRDGLLIEFFETRRAKGATEGASVRPHTTAMAGEDAGKNRRRRP